MRFIIYWVFAFISLNFAVLASAVEDPAHGELRLLRTEMIDAITKGDTSKVLQHTHPNVVITWQNAVVCRGHQGLKDFLSQNAKDSFKGYKIPPTADELTIFHGANTGVSFGHVVASYRLLGKDYDLKSRWTATLVKENGQWQLAAYHVSMNVLDNPILAATRTATYLGATAALIIGLVIGRYFICRKPKAV